MASILELPAELREMVLELLPGQSRIALTNTCRSYRLYRSNTLVQTALEARQEFEANFTEANDSAARARVFKRLLDSGDAEEDALQCIDRLTVFPSARIAGLCLQWQRMLNDAESIPHLHILYIRRYPCAFHDVELGPFTTFLLRSNLTFLHLHVHRQHEIKWLKAVLDFAPNNLETVSLTGQAEDCFQLEHRQALRVANENEIATNGHIQQSRYVKILLLRYFSMIDLHEEMKLDTMISIDSNWDLLKMPRSIKNLAILGSKAGDHDATSSATIHLFNQLESLFCEWTDGQYYSAKDRLPSSVRYLGFYGVHPASVKDVFNMVKGSNIRYLFIQVQKVPDWTVEMTAAEEEGMQWMVLEAGKLWWNPFNTAQFTSLRRLRGHLKHEDVWWYNCQTSWRPGQTVRVETEDGEE